MLTIPSPRAGRYLPGRNETVIADVQANTLRPTLPDLA
jgi:hypothetical protein